MRPTNRRHAHRSADAIAAGDAPSAIGRLRRHPEAEGSYLDRWRSTRQLRPDDVVLGEHLGTKRAEPTPGSLHRASSSTTFRRALFAASCGDMQVTIPARAV